jgi:hypothetical protein
MPWIFVAQHALADTSASGATKRFTFSYPFVPGDSMAPRGGTTTGTEIQLAPVPTPGWERLQAPDLSPLERDRLAILAMVGEWRASFDFIETMGFAPDYTATRPYQSWATEFVTAVVDEPEHIVLQHVLVMTFKQEDGTVVGPFVTKHWRQDWHYEATRYHEYQGQNEWREVVLSPEDVKGQWVQTVWQVDDSPRYASIGAWTHAEGVSQWQGQTTLRPLPRRESSVRSDYDALRAVNRHVITPGGWIHEEYNDKLRLTGDTPRVIARELGVNRYDAIVEYDFAAGRRYWQDTDVFWAIVREQWTTIWRDNPTFTFEASIDGRVLFRELLNYAADLAEGDNTPSPEAMRQFVTDTLGHHITAATHTATQRGP